MPRIWPIRFLVALVLLVIGGGSALAQDEGLTLGVQRTYGYGSGSQIQGNFRLTAHGPEDLTAVVFTLDGQALATDTEPPFELPFVTGQHALGWHELGATGMTASGQTLTAPAKRFEFVSSDEAWQTVSAIVWPILGVLVLVMVVSLGMPLLQAARGRGQPPLPLGAPRRYGLLGGTVCPKCGRPFGLHWWAFNILTGKLDRCDHCGRWSMVRALPRDTLAQAEVAEQVEAQPRPPAVSDDEARRRALEESRFEE